MYTLLIAIIYLIFISLGLPDTVLSSAWPVMHTELSVPLSYMGIITMIISAGTVISSLLSDYMIKRFKVAKVTFISVMLTAVALFGFSISNKFIYLCLWAIPYGLGAGAVDAAVNNYVAIHYSSKHMSWLHCFWGLGTIISPFIMSYCLTQNSNWHNGYLIVATIQIIITAILFFSMPLWKNQKDIKEETKEKSKNLFQVLKIPSVISILIAFFAYDALELTAGYWATSYLVNFKGTNVEIAAQFASLFYIGITVGRLICGFMANRIGDKNFIRIGTIVIFVGIVLMLVPVNSNILSLLGLIIIGIGSAPIYPSIIHSTPYNFGEENSQAIIGIEMASAYIGATFMPMIFGFLSDILGIGFYPIYLMILVLLMLVMSERLNKIKA